MQLLENGGMLPVQQSSEGSKEISPRRRGVKQGMILLLMGAVIVPILGVLNSFANGSTLLDIFVAIAAIVCFIGGPLRMIYAALFEDAAPTGPKTSPYMQPSLNSGMAGYDRAALRSVPMNPAASWSRRPNTAELVQPPSITENTTRLLEKDESEDR